MNWFFWRKQQRPIKERSLDEIKKVCKILFIDDKSFPVVNILKTAGWINTRSIKDVEALEQTEIKEAQILFVDIQGVGKKLQFKDEGLGLILALKQRYPNKKVVVYSAEDHGKIQAFHKGIDAADKRLSKHADPYQFQIVVENYAKEIFSLYKCVERIKTQLLQEFGRSEDTDKVIKMMQNIYLKGDYTEKQISKVFNIDNATKIAKILKFFFSTI